MQVHEQMDRINRYVAMTEETPLEATQGPNV
jgi:hypothetical protein